MARKTILSGGKKDEIIAAALKLFVEKGYDDTSIRMILGEVGGEIGMFYHYFKSKDEVFEAAVNLFLKRYAEGFGRIAEDTQVGPAAQLSALLGWFRSAMEEYNAFMGKSGLGKIGFPQREALHSRTIDSLVPHVEKILTNAIASGFVHNPQGISEHELTQIVLHGFAGVMDLINTDGPVQEEELKRRYSRASVLASSMLGIPAELFLAKA
jgi:AcrR family transcriptional regulator